MTAGSTKTLNTEMSEEIKKLLSQEFDNEKNQVVPMHMNERFDNDITKLRQRRLLLDIPNMSNLEKTRTKYDIPIKTDTLSRLKKIHEYDRLFDTSVSMRNKLKDETKESDSEETSSINSQKITKFSDHMKQVRTVLSNEIDIKLCDKDNTSLKTSKKQQFKQIDKKYEETDSMGIIKKLNKIVEESVVLLDQKKYVQLKEENMETIRELVNELQDNYYAEEYEKLLEDEPRSILEHEFQNIKLSHKNLSSDIVKNRSEINELETKIQKFINLFKILEIQDKIETEKRKKLVKEKRELKKQVTLWKERYAESQTALATANNQSTKKLFEFKNCILHLASEVATCIKQATTLIFDKFIMKGDEQSFEKTKSTENLNNSTLMIDNEILPSMIETSITKVVSELYDKIMKHLSSHKDISNNLKEESPKKLLSRASKVMLNNTDNEKCKCELTKQLGDGQQTNMDCKSTVEQVESKIKKTNDMKKTKKHNKDFDILSFYFTPQYAEILKDFCILNGYKIFGKEIIDNKKFNELPEEDKKDVDDCENIRKSPKSTVSSKSSKSLKSVPKITPVEQLRTSAAQGTCTYCSLSKTIFDNIEN